MSAMSKFFTPIIKSPCIECLGISSKEQDEVERVQETYLREIDIVKEEWAESESGKESGKI
jgi:hypothetical protein